jgi:hypothetical protein
MTPYVKKSRLIEINAILRNRKQGFFESVKNQMLFNKSILSGGLKAAR